MAQEKLRELFVGKPFGILGDGGFTFNRKKDDVTIKGFTPQRRAQKERGAPKSSRPHLSDNAKEYNRRLSHMRVVVENSFAQLKRWKILSAPFRFYIAKRDSQQHHSSLDFNKILRICVALTNRRLAVTPIRSPSWRPPQLHTIVPPTHNACHLRANSPSPVIPAHLFPVISLLPQANRAHIA